MSDIIQNITDNNFQKTVLESELPVLVDFWAPWCSPCRMIAPILEEIAQEYSDKIKIVKINVDENSETATKLEIRSIPTLIIFNRGNIVSTQRGALPKAQLVEQIKKVLEL